MPVVSLLILVAYAFGCLYLIVVGILGAVYGEPLGFLFLAMGCLGAVPFLRGWLRV